jgi:AI-2 transport protein TqsA
MRYKKSYRKIRKMACPEVGLSTLVVIISMIFWGRVPGPIGMLLSVPLTMIAKITLATNADTRWLADMLE